MVTESRVKDEVIRAYNFLFYELDEDEIDLLGLDQFDKTGLGKSFPMAAALQSEGAPTIIPLSSSRQGVDLKDAPHGGPLGYMMYITWLQQAKGGESIGDGVRFTLYHEGTGFILEGKFCLPPPQTYINWLNCIEPTGKERPIDVKDLGRLRGSLDQLSRIYHAAWPHTFRQPYRPIGSIHPFDF